MTTMKEGVGDDPFGDDEEPDDEPQARDDTDAMNTETTPEPVESSSETTTTSDIPYVLQRETVKEDRPNEAVAFLRDEFDELEDDVHGRVAEAMGMRKKDVPLTDVREAFIELASRHPDELGDILLDWGHEHRRD